MNTGRVATTIFKGDEGCTSAGVELKEAIVEFNATLALFGHSVGFQTFEEVKGIIYTFIIIY